MAHNKVVKSIKGKSERSKMGAAYDMREGAKTGRMHSGRGHHLSHENMGSNDHFMPGSYRLAGPKHWGHGHKQPHKSK